MKQEQNNTFTEGLIQDLNPINTPNTVLTDNLNGTIITYDGNEFSLQNDRGNYPLQYCKLKPNYIPVGVKEYADTLYIVSYNPLDNKTEIGSYPSPLEISSSNDGGDIINIPSLIEQSEKYPNYTKLVEQTQMQVFSDDELKLYPGDEYQIKLFDESKYIYEELEYYIIDENRNKYNITEHIKENSDFCPTGWTVPGWMAVQYRLAAFEDFQMNVRSFAIPSLAKNSNGTLKLNFQLKISDKLFLNRLYFNENVKHLDEIGIKIKILNNDSVKYSNEDFFVDMNGDIVEWYEESKILWAQKEFNINNINQGDKISIQAIPFIQVTVDDKIYKIEYDNCKETIDVSIANIGSYDDFVFANNTWKFWLEEEDPDNLYLEFDIGGPIITSNTINLYYKISELPGTHERSTGYIPLESYNGIGQNMILLPFKEENNKWFVPENIYVIEFAFAEQDPDTTDNKKSFKKLIIASQIFSHFVNNTKNFESITFDEWVAKYPNTIKNVDKWTISVSGGDVPGEQFVKGKIDSNGISEVNVPECLKKFWKTSNNFNKYNHTAFIKENDWEEISNEQTSFLRGYKTNADIKLSTELNIIKGPMWDSMNRILTINVTSHDDICNTISKDINYFEKDENKNTYNFDLTITPNVASKLTVSYKKLSEGLVRGSLSNNNTFNISDGIKYGIVLGNSKKSGSNNYIAAHFEGFNQIIPESSKDIKSKVKMLSGEYGTKSKVPNTLTGKISDFMSSNNLQFIVVFVIARPDESDDEIIIRSGENDLYKVYTDEVAMQPFIVMKNKQGTPIFFAINDINYKTFNIGSSNNGEEQGSYRYHAFPFNNWDNYSNLIERLNDIFKNIVIYHIKDISDGFFITCSLHEDSDYTLNIETDVNINKISNWTIGKYDLLNSTDRTSLIENLQGIKTGNLLLGVTSSIDSINCKGLKYNKSARNTIESDKNIELLKESIYLLQESAKTQWSTWEKDEIFSDSFSNNELFGITISNHGSIYANKFSKSDFFNLVQKSLTNSNISISASGEKLMFVNAESTGKSEYCIGLLHSSITFP